MDLLRLARRVSDKTKPKKTRKPGKTAVPLAPEVSDVSGDMLDPGVEYSFKVDLSLVADFEGDVSEISEDRLRRKFKAEILSAMKSAALMAASDFGLRATNIRVNPVTISSAVNDQTSVDERGR